jgi:MFS family permease
MAAVGATVSAFAIARLLLNLPSGIVADRIGRRPLLVAGPAITGVGMIGSALAGTFHELLAWRFITGAGSALQMSGSQLFLADVSTRENRAKTLGTNQVRTPGPRATVFLFH